MNTEADQQSKSCSVKGSPSNWSQQTMEERIILNEIVFFVKD